MPKVKVTVTVEFPDDEDDYEEVVEEGSEDLADAIGFYELSEDDDEEEMPETEPGKVEPLWVDAWAEGNTSDIGPAKLKRKRNRTKSKAA